MANILKTLWFVCFVFVLPTYGQYEEIYRILSKCRLKSTKFDSCLKDALNDIRPYFKAGIPELGVASFDPHFATVVNQKRGDNNLNYNLKLTNVYEFGWTISKITKLRTDWKNDRIIYSQYFPEKSLKGDYELNAYAFGNKVDRKGSWNLTLYDYAQTTIITRKPTFVNGARIYDGQPLDVKVSIDRIGNMDIHVSNIFNGASIVENLVDVVVNSMWRVGFGVVKPFINDLVSTAFTQIWTDSFKHFPISQIFQS